VFQDTEPKPPSIAALLLQARQARGLTRNQARHAIGYTFDRYALTESGERLPQPIELPSLALWLVGGEGGLDRFLETLRTLRTQLAIERGHAAEATAEVAP
jgi:transcriptional regulator with XRE-family HTH domain